jgi:N utilization substance protein A
VPDDQLSLAIGREGQNARLAARLTGWRIDIRSETEFAQEEQDGDYGEEAQELDGRCHAVLTSGRRCPNAALPVRATAASTPIRRCRDRHGQHRRPRRGVAVDEVEPGEQSVADEPVVDDAVVAGEAASIASDEAVAGSAAD